MNPDLKKMTLSLKKTDPPGLVDNTNVTENIIAFNSTKAKAVETYWYQVMQQSSASETETQPILVSRVLFDCRQDFSSLPQGII